MLFIFMYQYNTTQKYLLTVHKSVGLSNVTKHIFDDIQKNIA